MQTLQRHRGVGGPAEVEARGAAAWGREAAQAHAAALARGAGKVEGHPAGAGGHRRPRVAPRGCDGGRAREALLRRRVGASLQRRRRCRSDTDCCWKLCSPARDFKVMSHQGLLVQGTRPTAEAQQQSVSSKTLAIAELPSREGLPAGLGTGPRGWRCPATTAPRCCSSGACRAAGSRAVDSRGAGSPVQIGMAREAFVFDGR